MLYRPAFIVPVKTLSAVQQWRHSNAYAVCRNGRHEAAFRHDESIHASKVLTPSFHGRTLHTWAAMQRTPLAAANVCLFKYRHYHFIEGEGKPDASRYV